MQLLFQVFQPSTDEGAAFEKQPEQKPYFPLHVLESLSSLKKGQCFFLLVSFNAKA